MQLPQWASGETFFFFFPPSEEYMKETWLSSQMWSAALACRGSVSVEDDSLGQSAQSWQGTNVSPPSERARVTQDFSLSGSLLSIKLRSTLATNKRENSPRSLPLYNVKRPYVMELHKHKQCKHNSVERAVKLREKGIWGKDYGLGGACGGGCQICLPEARCSLAYFIRLNIVLIQCWRANKQTAACVGSI